jgi:hypothetical protein
VAARRRRTPTWGPSTTHSRLDRSDNCAAPSTRSAASWANCLLEPPDTRRNSVPSSVGPSRRLLLCKSKHSVACVSECCGPRQRPLVVTVRPVQDLVQAGGVGAIRLHQLLHLDHMKWYAHTCMHAMVAAVVVCRRPTLVERVCVCRFHTANGVHANWIRLHACICVRVCVCVCARESRSANQFAPPWTFLDDRRQSDTARHDHASVCVCACSSDHQTWMS